MIMVKDYELILWFQGILLDQTSAGSRVYASKTRPEDMDGESFINIIIPDGELERSDANSRGAAKDDHRLVVVLAVQGSDKPDPLADWILYKLDILDEKCRGLLDKPHMPLGAPGEVITVTLTNYGMKREQAKEQYAEKYLYFTIKTLVQL